MKIVINIEKNDEDTEYELGPDGEWIKKEETKVERKIRGGTINHLGFLLLLKLF